MGLVALGFLVSCFGFIDVGILQLVVVSRCGVVVGLPVFCVVLGCCLSVSGFGCGLCVIWCYALAFGLLESYLSVFAFACWAFVDCFFVPGDLGD